MEIFNELIEFKVIKRDGTSEPFQIKKIMLMVEWACDGKNVSPSKLYEKFIPFLVDEMKTSIIQNQLIKVALSLTTIIEPDWADVAGSLLLLNLYKNHKEYINDNSIFGYSTLYDFIIASTNDLLLDQDIVEKYSKKEIDSINEEIDIEYDEFDYSGINLLDKRYLIQYKGKTVEPAQFMYILTAMVIFKDIPDKVRRLKLVKECYTLFAQQILSPATPNLSNLRKYGRGSSPSCFILKAEDDLDSIYNTLHRAAVISKNGGASGVYLSSIRGNGSNIKGIKGAAKGVLPFMKLFNDTAVAVDQLGNRVGAITVALDVWHTDFFDFLNMRKENIDIRVQCQDLFGQVCINDIFVERYNEAKKNDSHDPNWLQFCPHEFFLQTGIHIEDLYGEAFREAYNKAEELFNNGVYLNAKNVSSREVMKRILETCKETGLPYIFNKDYVNECNPNKHKGIIYCSNLCVAPETVILTDQGYLKIEDLVDENVKIWNGEEWSEVSVVKTGDNQELLKVNLSSGDSLECTPYHKWYIQKGFSRGGIIEKRTHELKPGDKLIKFDLPIIQGSDTFSFAYDNGFFSADGNHSNNIDRIYLYHKKRDLKKYFESVSVWSEDENQNRSTGRAIGLKPKYFVPDCSYTIESRLLWLSGFLDGDGCVVNVGENQSIQASSIHKEFLISISRMLQELGVHSKVVDLYPERDVLLPVNDGSGNKKEYHANRTWRLLISSSSLFKLSQLGFSTNRLKWIEKFPQRNSEEFIRVTSIENNGRKDDTYCFTEHKRHMGMFNGILTGQCVESFSTFNEEYSHVCNLTSLNLAKIDTLEKLEQAVRMAVVSLNQIVTLSTSPLESTRKHNDLFRIIGIGALGYHDHLVLKGMNYTGSADYAYELFEKIAYWAIDESVNETNYLGEYPAFSGSDWENGIFFGRNVYDEDFSSTPGMNEKWIRLYENKVSKFGMANGGLLAIAPNTGTSQLVNSSASILPVYSKFFIEKNKLMAVPFAAKYLSDKTFWLYQEAININPEAVIDVCQNVQQWVDQGISMELVLNPNLYNSAKTLRDWYLKAITGNGNLRSKTIYYLRPLQADKIECSSCAN